MNYEQLTKQAYRLYFCLREQSRVPNVYSVRRERLNALFVKAFERYQRRVDKQFYGKKI
jgi:hypothetical protein